MNALFLASFIITANARCTVKEGHEAYRQLCYNSNKRNCLWYRGACKWEGPTKKPEPTTPMEATLTMKHKVAYVDGEMGYWRAPNEMFAKNGEPRYNKCMDGTTYNVAVLYNWTPYSNRRAVQIWEHPKKFIRDADLIHESEDSIRRILKKSYNDHGIKLLLSASTWGEPNEACTTMAKWALAHHFDGIDLRMWSIYDSSQDGREGGDESGGVASIWDGTGVAWLIACTRAIRKVMPTEKGFILTHAPAAGWFTSDKTIYKNGAYLTVHKEVGHLIDWYNVSYNAHDDWNYNSCKTLFEESKHWVGTAAESGRIGTAVNQIVASGVEKSKIVIARAAIPNLDAEWINQCLLDDHFNTGIAVYWFDWDDNCSWINRVTRGYL